MKIKLLVAVVLSFGLLMVCGPVMAHHGNAAYADKPTEFKNAKITKFNWANPHALIFFDVKGADGTTTVWSLETVGPNGLRRLGLSDRRLFKIGDEYKIDIHPDRSGKSLGFVNSFTFPDGKYIKVGFPDEPGGEPPAN